MCFLGKPWAVVSDEVTGAGAGGDKKRRGKKRRPDVWGEQAESAQQGH